MSRSQRRFESEDEAFYGTVGSIGIPKFDKVMRGGIPRGFTIIAFGDPGAGMELFAKQFSSPAEDPDNTLFVSTNETRIDVLGVMRKFEWPTDLRVRTLGEEYNERVLQRQLRASRYRLEGFSLQDIQRLAQTRFVNGETEDFLTEMTSSIVSLKDYFRASVDSLDFFLQRDDPGRVVSMVRMMQAHTQMHRGMLLLTNSSGAMDAATEQELSSIADIVLRFEVVMMGSEFETRMVIRKFRNAPENMAIITYRVTPEEAITPETVQRII